MLNRKKAIKNKKYNPFKTITIGFLIYIFLGLVFISMPIAQKIHVSFIDNLFNIVSAFSTTGLSTGALSELYTPFGKLVLLTLIQLGAIGYMTLTSFFILARSDNLSTQRIKILSAEFPLPERFEVKKFIKHVIIFTFSVELIGTLLLWHQFRLCGLDKPLWSALFHSVSSFATAGFSIYPDSLIRFQDNVMVNLIIISLCYLGSIGFIVPMDIYKRLRGESREITLTSKIIIILTAFICITGTLIYMGSAQSGVLSALFQVASASTTAGYNTVDLAKLPNAALFILIFAMIIGASPSGTGGGIKTTSISALMGVISSVIKGHPERITFLNRTIPSNRVMTAVAITITYLSILSLSVLLVCLVDNHSFLEICFETASALGTVGLSLGITPDLSLAAKFILSITMFLGRLGPLTLGIAFFRSTIKNNVIACQSDLAV